MPQRDFARQMLSIIKRDPRFPPFVAAVDDAVDTLLEDAVSVARTVGVLANSNNDSSSYRLRDQGPIPAAAQAAANYYRPVLTQLFEAALKLHLQVQGTNSTAYIFVPGKQLRTTPSLDFETPAAWPKHACGSAWRIHKSSVL